MCDDATGMEASKFNFEPVAILSVLVKYTISSVQFMGFGSCQACG